MLKNTIIRHGFRLLIGCLFAEKPDDEEAAKQDTFIEKTISLVIRNLQVKVKNIHIRFEDEFTNRSRPFSAGFTLDSLLFQVLELLCFWK